MILRKVNREEKNEIEIVYNMDDAPFVLRYADKIYKMGEIMDRNGYEFIFAEEII